METLPKFAVWGLAPHAVDEWKLVFLKHINAKNSKDAVQIAKRTIVAPVIGPELVPRRKAH